tara:strand:+ start:495 stop:722 length:228 start_codon:yes stop_codon:yes gene_type:complete
MIGYILTPEEKDQIQGQYYTQYQFLNCVQDINGVWYLFLSDEDQPEVEASQYAWVLNLPQGEYTPPLPPPFPPTE